MSLEQADLKTPVAALGLSTRARNALERTNVLTVRDLLIDLQDKGDDPKHVHQKGSWSPRADPYAKQGGRIMFTALAIITLETYYYHVPLYGYGPCVFD